MNKLKVSELIDYPEKFFVQVKDCIKELQALSKKYVEMDTLYDVEGLEQLKRDVTAQLEFLANHYSRTKKFKTGGDYLEETRKFLKSKSILLLVGDNERGLSNNQAEKEIYAYPYYKDRVDLMQDVKSYFINIEVMYGHYKTMLSSIVQSISLCKKEANYKYVNNE